MLDITPCVLVDQNGNKVTKNLEISEIIDIRMNGVQVLPVDEQLDEKTSYWVAVNVIA